jgi:hypothetical protein
MTEFVLKVVKKFKTDIICVCKNDIRIMDRKH